VIAHGVAGIAKIMLQATMVNPATAALAVAVVQFNVMAHAVFLLVVVLL